MESGELWLCSSREPPHPPAPAGSQLCGDVQRDMYSASGGGTSGFGEHLIPVDLYNHVKKEEAEDEAYLCGERSNCVENVDQEMTGFQRKPVKMEESEDNDYLCVTASGMPSLLRINLWDRQQIPRNLPTAQPHQLPQPCQQTSKAPLGSKERSRKFRENMKKDPERYKLYLQESAVRSKLYRASMTDEKRAFEREKAKLRMQKYRSHRKTTQLEAERGDVSSGPVKCTTHGDEEKKRQEHEKWKIAKRSQRKLMSSLKKRRINEMMRVLYHQQKIEVGKGSVQQHRAPIFPHVPDPATNNDFAEEDTSSDRGENHNDIGTRFYGLEPEDTDSAHDAENCNEPQQSESKAEQTRCNPKDQRPFLLQANRAQHGHARPAGESMNFRESVCCVTSRGEGQDLCCMRSYDDVCICDFTTMNLKLEQRANIKFCVKLGKSARETLALLHQVYGNKTMSRVRCFEWYSRFKRGRLSLEDDERSGRPCKNKTS
ncbi:uncharacterized protein LOC132883075 isoform X2 [Neoarius graeffei]|uniref:uncharacterized protein LOC132883075 isoform X2 n=1 Tax=Neoarius graeffei TaxID=443677 RepID=UPI00298CBF4F|nr:uncharacterized protein LOC132883075 isoform X2 [Neoarius graeffei]